MVDTTDVRMQSTDVSGNTPLWFHLLSNGKSVPIDLESEEIPELTVQMSLSNVGVTINGRPLSPKELSKLDSGDEESEPLWLNADNNLTHYGVFFHDDTTYYENEGRIGWPNAAIMFNPRREAQAHRQLLNLSEREQDKVGHEGGRTEDNTGFGVSKESLEHYAGKTFREFNRLNNLSEKKNRRERNAFLRAGKFNPLNEAYALCDGFLEEIFKENESLTEDRAEDLFFKTYIEPIKKQLESRGYNFIEPAKTEKRYNRLRRKNPNEFKTLEVLIGDYISLYKSALNRKLGNDIVFLYGLADGKKLCSAEKAYSLFESSEEYNILVDLVLNNALGDNSQDTEELFRQDVTLTDRAAYQSVLSDLEGRKLIESKGKKDMSEVKMTEAGVRAYNLGKIIPCGVGIDLTTSILESIYSGAKTRADITGMFPASEPYRAIDSAVNSLKGMNFISVRNDRVQITPDGIAAYEGVVKRILKDVEGHGSLYNEFRNTAKNLGIKVGEQHECHPGVEHPGQRVLSVWQGMPAKVYSAQ